MNKARMREGFVSHDDDKTDEPVVELEKRPQRKAVAPSEEDEPAPATEATKPDTWPMVVPMRYRSVRQGPGEPELKELTFREPTSGDIMRAGGNPCRIEVTQVAGNQWVYNPIIDDGKMVRLMANLSGVMQPFLERMDPRDYASCAHRLRRFFLPDPDSIW